jgi:hypothetical protein
VRTILSTPPAPRIVPEGVFDAFRWCDSDELEWRRPDAWDRHAEVTASNPPGMVFILRHECDFLPRELGRLHAPGLDLEEEWALAPYAIDDATDALHARRVTPGRLLWLAAADLAGLVWGLHDWSHFHNHGPFEARAMTELQCDAAALVWLSINLASVGIDEAAWERVRCALAVVAAARFAEERASFDPAWLARERLIEIANAISPHPHSLPAGREGDRARGVS